ncbi:hypothetical protein Ahy_A09g042820 isoform A [Arachis hypogaea]|uniref:Uncharacterized protein n=1 Tax=Arachis hypogaea TaxID=3818 RepID=A0A445BGZ4_ARAHY|nr:hypothetical protein Ahy_A09g042820 isoform A [Arachis hypogaea]
MVGLNGEVLQLFIRNWLSCLSLVFLFPFFFWVKTELDALELDMGNETEADGVPSYLQPDKETDLEAELNLPPAPTGQTTVPAGRSNPQNEDELGLPAVPRASLRDMSQGPVKLCRTCLIYLAISWSGDVWKLFDLCYLFPVISLLES